MALALVKRRLPELMSADPLAALPDGLHVVIVGSGSPIPDPRRGNPCAAVLAGDRLFIVDAGEGSSETLNRLRINPGRIESVLLTHFHSDHIGGLASVNLQRWIAEGVDTPMRVLGPPGVERVVDGLNEAYALDSSYRTAHHGEEIASPATSAMSPETFEIPPGGQALTLIDDGLRVTAFPVDHHPVAPALGFRFDYAGRSLVISGDTVYAPPLVEASQGADLLIHDALGRELLKLVENAAGEAGLDRRRKIMADIWDYHATPQEAARAATEAGVGALALTHIVPPLPLKGLEGPFLGDARDRFAGPLWLAEDGDLYGLPRGGEGVERSNLMPRRG